MDVRELRPEDLDAADLLVRVAFGTYLGLDDPTAMFGSAQMVRTRFRQFPAGSLAAYDGTELVGLVQLARWGSAAVLGPLATLPSHWNGGVARHLLDASTERLDAEGARVCGLFTFASSPQHVGLYHRAGFRAQHLVALMTKAVEGPAESPMTLGSLDGTTAIEQRLARLTDSLYPGLDLTSEMRTVLDQGVGDVVVLDDEEGFAICHLGAGDADAGVAYVKFAAVRPGERAARDFAELNSRVEALAASRSLAKVEVGVDTARRRAHQALLNAGYRTQTLGVRMSRPDEVGWSRADQLVLDDLR